MLIKRGRLSLPESMILSALILACMATLDISLYIHSERHAPRQRIRKVAMCTPQK